MSQLVPLQIAEATIYDTTDTPVAGDKLLGVYLGAGGGGGGSSVTIKDGFSSNLAVVNPASTSQLASDNVLLTKTVGQSGLGVETKIAGGAVTGFETALVVQSMDQGGRAMNQAAAPFAHVNIGPQIMGSDGTNAQRIKTDTSGNLTTVSAAPSTLLNGSTTVTTAGTPVALAASTACRSVIVQAKTGNTGTIKVGNASTQTITLVSGQSVSIDIDNLSKVFLDATVNGEGVNYIGA